MDEYLITKQGIEELAIELCRETDDWFAMGGLEPCTGIHRDVEAIILSHCKVRPEPDAIRMLNKAAAIMQSCDLESDYYLSDKRARTIKRDMGEFLTEMLDKFPPHAESSQGEPK